MLNIVDLCGTFMLIVQNKTSPTQGLIQAYGWIVSTFYIKNDHIKQHT